MKSQLILIAQSCIAIAICVVLTVGCGESQNNANNDRKQVSQPVSDEAAQASYQELKQQFEADIAKLRTSIESADSDLEKQKLFAASNLLQKYMDQLLDLARDYPSTPTAFSAVLEAVSRSKGDNKHVPMLYLIENFADQLEYAQLINSFHQEIPSPNVEAWFSQLIENTPDKLDKAAAILGLAKYVDRIPEFCHGFEKNPHLMAKLPVAQQEYLQAKRTEQQDSKLASLLQFVIDNHATDNYRGQESYADVAKHELYELQYLSVGKPAPDIVGQDLDGVEFRLSDYRGKVVMLDFWGHWCPPCRAMYGQERELVEKLGSVPFVLLGVNSDKQLKFARNAVRDEGLVWRHFWNGSGGTQGNIAGKWNIESWPTVYLIDADGIIRHKNLLGKDLDRAIEKLLVEAGHSVDLSNLN